jgi:hypothetical protein
LTTKRSDLEREITMTTEQLAAAQEAAKRLERIPCAMTDVICPVDDLALVLAAYRWYAKAEEIMIRERFGVDCVCWAPRFVFMAIDDEDCHVGPGADRPSAAIHAATDFLEREGKHGEVR